MGISTLVDLVKVLTTTSGTGPLVLDAAVPSFRGVEALVAGKVYSYSIQLGSNYEFGTGVFDGSSLTRGVVGSSYGNGPIPLTPGATVTFVALAQDVQSGLTGQQGPATLQLGFFFTTPLAASEVIALYTAAVRYTYPVNFSSLAATSVGSVGTNPAASFVLTVARQVGGLGAFSTIGTITISAAGAFVFATVGPDPIVIGASDVVRVTGPLTPDAAAANVSVTLKGF